MLPNKPRGVPRVNDRRVLNGIFWVPRSGAPGRDLPATLAGCIAAPELRYASSGRCLAVGLFDLGAGGSYAFAPACDFAPDECVRGFGRKSRQFPVALEIFRRFGVVGNPVDRLVQRGNDIGRSSLRNPKPDPGRTFGARIPEFGQAGAVWYDRITRGGRDSEAGQAAFGQLADDAGRSGRSETVDLTTDCRLHGGLAATERHMDDAGLGIVLEEREPRQV